jgi:6-pyruvoyl-tetrahydropterin synthase
METSVSMYYANLTNIDLAMVMPEGNLRGDSFNLHLELTGEEDPVESVLIDFSTAKKRVKSWIDDHSGQGFDHKCWVFTHSSAFVDVDIDNQAIELDSLPELLSEFEGTKTIKVSLPSTTITAPLNCFNFIPVPEDMPFNTQNCMRVAEQSIEKYLVAKFKNDGQTISVKVKLTNNFSYPAFSSKELQGFSFRYTHGLKHSTSFGCQNIVHGHLSYITFKEKAHTESNFMQGSREFHREAIEAIVSKLNNKVFAWEENVSLLPGDEDRLPSLLIKYDSPRGYMTQQLNAPDCIVLTVETTVEHIAQYIATKYREELLALDIESVYVSEGLEKGGIAHTYLEYPDTETLFRYL